MLETLRLDDKSAVVTGSGRGLGKAMAKALAQAGAEVVCAARTPEQIDETVQEILADGGRALAVVTDVTDSAQVDRLMQTCVDTYGKLDIMVANAGGGGVSRGDWEFWEYPDDAFESVLAVNLKSNFYCDRAASKHMVERGAGGVIINVASGTALRGNRHFAYPTAKGGTISLTKSAATILGPHNIMTTHVLGQRGVANSSVYSAAHGAVHNLIRALAQEMAPHGISVNGVALGWMDWMDDRLDPDDADADRAVRFAISKRTGTPDDVGPIAVWLAGSGVGFVTGQIFPVDGGLTQHL